MATLVPDRAKETLAIVASSGEPLYPTFKWYLETFDIKELTVPELFKASRLSVSFCQMLILVAAQHAAGGMAIPVRRGMAQHEVKDRDRTTNRLLDHTLRSVSRFPSRLPRLVGLFQLMEPARLSQHCSTTQTYEGRYRQRQER